MQATLRVCGGRGEAVIWRCLQSRPSYGVQKVICHLPRLKVDRQSDRGPLLRYFRLHLTQPHWLIVHVDVAARSTGFTTEGWHVTRRLAHSLKPGASSKPRPSTRSFDVDLYLEQLEMPAAAAFWVARPLLDREQVEVWRGRRARGPPPRARKDRAVLHHDAVEF